MKIIYVLKYDVKTIFEIAMQTLCLVVKFYQQVHSVMRNKLSNFVDDIISTDIFMTSELSIMK